MKKLLLPIFTLSVFLLIVPSSYALFGQKRARALAEEKARRAILEKQRVQNELLVVGGILVVVIIVAVVKINNPKAIPAIIQEVVVVRTPAHEIVANSVVIDATNVVRSSQGDPPCLLRLIGLLLELENRRYTYKCFFDANTGYVLEESGQREQAKAYRELLRDYYNIFIEVPGRTRADDFILDYAHSHGTPIISMTVTVIMQGNILG